MSSLNGEPEQGVAVEAVGQKDCSIYGEDTVTDEEGKFRLRGLLVRLCVMSLWHSVGQQDGGGTLESPILADWCVFSQQACFGLWENKACKGGLAWLCPECLWRMPGL